MDRRWGLRNSGRSVPSRASRRRTNPTVVPPPVPTGSPSAGPQRTRGTVFVDVESSQVLDVLPDRTSKRLPAHGRRGPRWPAGGESKQKCVNQARYRLRWARRAGHREDREPAYLPRDPPPYHQTYVRRHGHPGRNPPGVPTASPAAALEDLREIATTLRDSWNRNGAGGRGDWGLRQFTRKS